MKTSLQQPYDELTFYTLSLRDAEFIHQHIVDAQTVQTANENTKPISLVFSLVGLYLYVEKGYTGKEVQRFHIQMAKHKKRWPSIELPLQRGKITVADVIEASPGEDRNKMIHDWCASVWKACVSVREMIADIVKTQGEKTLR